MYARISTADAHERLQAGGVSMVDVRDADSHAASRIPGSVHLSSETLPSFISSADKATPVVLYCYHGNISQQAGQYLDKQGFGEVYSMDGGFEEWRTQYPDQCTSGRDAAAAD